MVSNELVGLRLLRVRSADGRTHVGLLAGDELSILATDDMLAVLESDPPVAEVVHVTIADPETCAPPDPWQLLVRSSRPRPGPPASRTSAAATRGCTRATSPTSTTWSTRRTDPNCSSRMPPGAGRSPPESRSRPARTRARSVPEPELAVVIDAAGDIRSRRRSPMTSPRATSRAPTRCTCRRPRSTPARARSARALLVPADWTAPFEIELRILGPDREILFSGADVDRPHATHDPRADLESCAAITRCRRQRAPYRHRSRAARPRHACSRSGRRSRSRASARCATRSAGRLNRPRERRARASQHRLDERECLTRPRARTA